MKELMELRIKRGNELRELFSKCGNGVLILCMDNENVGGVRWRICRDYVWKKGMKVNWVKCKEILNKRGIDFIEGESGWGMRESRCIDFNYK